MKLYCIELTFGNQSPHIWTEGGLYSTKAKAEFQAKQIRKMRRYKSVKTKTI